MGSRSLALLTLLCASIASANSLILDATTKSLELETSSSASTDYAVAYVDNTSSTFVPGLNQGNVASATTTAILAAPAASTQRQVKWLTLKNRSTTTAQGVTLKLDVSATEYHLAPTVTLAPGESARWDADGDLVVYTSAGLERRQSVSDVGYTGRPFILAKAGTAKDAAGYWMAYAKDAGHPGAMALGTPGVNGATTDCSVASQTSPAGASQMGAHYMQDPASGSLYLTAASLAGTVTEHYLLVDILWYNTGLSVTTTTAQTITMPTIPARDLYGATNGDGVYAALYALTALGNTAAISNTTISYTDSDGNAGNTGTFQAVAGWQAPATPVIGTWMPFQLAAGDRGVRSIQSITLGTSYTSGTMSLILFRPLAAIPNPTASVGGIMANIHSLAPPGVRLWNDTCIWLISVGSASASNPQGIYTVMER